jgi:hypothetical protein
MAILENGHALQKFDPFVCTGVVLLTQSAALRRMTKRSIKPEGSMGPVRRPRG